MQSTNQSIDIGFSNSLVELMNNESFIPLYFRPEQPPSYHSLVAKNNDEFVDILDILERGKYNTYVKDNIVYPTKKQGILGIISSMIKIMVDGE